MPFIPNGGGLFAYPGHRGAGVRIVALFGVS
jgi:hypothetical protein